LEQSKVRRLQFESICWVGTITSQPRAVAGHTPGLQGGLWGEPTRGRERVCRTWARQRSMFVDELWIEK
jgi:hypothetical protein